jgi:hypothetical protein
MANPSGYQEAFLVMERVDARFKIVDAFPSGFLAEADAAQRYLDTGKDYSIAQFLANIEDITSIINQINIEDIQTVFNFPFRPLPLKGDDSAGTPLTVEGFPVVRLNKNADDYITWTRRAPAGGASGVKFQFAWTPDGTATGNVKFKMTFNAFTSGILLSDIDPEEVYLNLAGPSHGGAWTQNRVYIHDMIPSGSLENVSTFNIRLEFLGPQSSVNKNINILNAAINYQSTA